MRLNRLALTPLAAVLLLPASGSSQIISRDQCLRGYDICRNDGIELRARQRDMEWDRWYQAQERARRLDDAREARELAQRLRNEDRSFDMRENQRRIQEHSMEVARAAQERARESQRLSMERAREAQQRAMDRAFEQRQRALERAAQDRERAIERARAAQDRAEAARFRIRPPE